MTRARVAAAIAAIITALLLQATVVAPAAFPWPVSLPAVLVAAVALMDGPATGMSFGFAAGLFADLGSHHPAGVLALCWMATGMVCGRLSDRRSIRRDALVAGVICGLSASITSVLLDLLHSGGSVRDAFVYLVPTCAADGVLALLVVALVRRMLRVESLCAPNQVFTDLVLTNVGGGFAPVRGRRD
jgi:rod shape-determining protein MreD